MSSILAQAQAAPPSPKSGSERNHLMPKFLVEATYTAEGHKGLGDSKILVLTRGRVVITVVLQTEEREILRDAISPSPVEMSDLALLHCRVSVQMKADRTSPATLR